MHRKESFAGNLTLALSFSLRATALENQLMTVMAIQMAQICTKTCAGSRNNVAEYGHGKVVKVGGVVAMHYLGVV
jgi:hypothetical protein